MMRCRTLKIPVLAMAFMLIFIVIPTSAEDFSSIDVGYTYIDGDTCDVFSYPAVDQFSHMGLSKGKVAYSKDKGPLIYIWDSRTGEIKTFDTTELADKKDDWISFWMEIKSVDISNGVAYYSLSTHKTTPTGTSSSSDGLFSFDGLNNVNIDSLSDHNIDDLLADNNIILMKDSWYDPESFSVLNKLRVYSSETEKVIIIDDKTQISDPIGFGEYKVATLAHSFGPQDSNDRVPGEGIAVFNLVPALAGKEVEQITIPEATDISPDEKVDVNQDCFSDKYFVWTKGWGITGRDRDRFQCNLYVTDLSTIQNNVIDTRDDLSFGLYTYAVDGDHLFYKNDDRIFLYHIPDGDRKEIRITGNEEFEVGDIVEFDEGQLLLRAYPKEFAGYEPSEYEIWFVDLNPYINSAGINESDEGITGTMGVNIKEIPVVLIVPTLAVIIVFVLFTVLIWRKNEKNTR